MPKPKQNLTSECVLLIESFLGLNTSLGILLLPPYLLLDTQNDAWLRFKRLCVGKFGTSRSFSSGETATRNGPGFPIRWGSPWLEEVGSEGGGWTNPDRDSRTTKARADILKARFLSDRRPLALRNGSA